MTYVRTALIRGIENANKHEPDSLACANGGLMEGILFDVYCHACLADLIADS